jgi:beta-glucanase (GH16 family)
MKSVLFLTLFIAIYTAVPQGYRLVWSDEFEGNSIDGSKWVYDLGGGGWGNNELECYTNRGQNSYVADGMLHIKAIKESYEGKDYTSARMKTKGKFEFQYGYVEARIKLPRGNGVWPAFWMLGQNIDSVNWPSCGEIDIVEAVNTENKIYATCHWFAGGGHADYGTNTNTDAGQFHVYTLLWNNEIIRVGIDGGQHYEMKIKDNVGETGAFHKKFFFLLNVAIGGNWPGFNVDPNALPAEMLVDYIRVYQP